MISRRVLINLAFFFVASFGLAAYGFFDLLGNPFRTPTKISTTLEDASGLRPDFSASLDGVVIGVVSGVELVEEGVEVTIALDSGVEIPGDVEAKVIRASAVGEQRVDLQPTRGGNAPPLEDGDTVPAADDATPPQVSQVLDTTVRVIEAIPPDTLNTVVHELAVAFEGRADDLRSLTTSTRTFNDEFLRHEQGFRDLLESAPPVLDSLTSVAPEFRSALRNTVVLTDVLAERRFDTTRLLRNGARFGEVANDILTAQQANLGCLLSDFADLNAFFGSPEPLSNFETGLVMNRSFFGPVDLIALAGRAVDVGLGAPTRHDQTWLRVRTLVPPPSPAAIAYEPKRATPPTLPGLACQSAFGPGVGPATQATPSPPGRGGSIQGGGSEQAAAGAVVLTALVLWARRSRRAER